MVLRTGHFTTPPGVDSSAGQRGGSAPTVGTVRLGAGVTGAPTGSTAIARVMTDGPRGSGFPGTGRLDATIEWAWLSTQR